MTEYIVNGTLTCSAWVQVYAASDAEALEAAEAIEPRYWEIDRDTSEIEYNVEPQVERDPWHMEQP